MKLFAVVLAAMMIMTRAEARVFDIGKEKFAGYMIGSYGQSTIDKSAYKDENTTGDTFSAGVTGNTTGEFGFLWATDYFGIRFGFEMFRPSQMKEVIASNVGGTAIYSINSDITGYAPKLGIEINLQKTPDYRAFITAYTGTASITYKNDYTIISYGGMSNHSVEGKGTALLTGATLGVESHLTDATTYIFEFGYRQMIADKLTYSKNVTTFSGAKVSGDPVTDVSGAARSFDFTGAYASFGFRFYL